MMTDVPAVTPLLGCTLDTWASQYRSVDGDDSDPRHYPLHRRRDALWLVLLQVILCLR